MRAIERTQTVAKSQSRSENCGEVVANGTAYKLNPASWDGADHDRQRVDHMPSPRGFAPGAVPSPGAYQEYHAHLSRTHEDGFSEPSVWPSPTGRLDGLPAYASPTITQSSYSDERTCEYVPCLVEMNPIDIFVHAQQSQTILQLQLALHHIPPDQILPRMVVQNSILLSIHNGLHNLLRFLVCGAPICAQTLRLTSFVMF